MNERIVWRDPSDINAGDMVVLDSGKLEVYNKIDGVRQKTTFLNNIVTGVATANEWSQISGFWQDAPTVILSLKKGPAYLSGYPLSAQRFTLSPIIEKVRDGVYRLYPECEFHADPISVNWNSGIDFADYDWIFDDSCAYPESCTPFYPCSGGTLSVDFRFKNAVQTTLGGGTAYDLYLRNEFYLDICRGTTYSSSLLYSSEGWATNYNWQNISRSYATGNGFCTWRLRRIISRLNTRTNGGAQGKALDFGLVSYSFSFLGDTIVPTDAEVFYLAVGR